MQLGRRGLGQSKTPPILDADPIKSLRHRQVEGISRRQLLAWSITGAVGLWLSEVVVGTFGFLWPNLTGGFGGVITIGKITDAESNLDVPGGPSFSAGAPARFPAAKLFVMLVDPAKYAFAPGTSPAGDGAETNVRTLYQACTHLGCTPNFCPKNFWFECRCHGSRYDRLGIKVESPRTCPPQPRPVLVGGECRWDPHGRHRQDLPRSPAGRTRPARPYPTGLTDRLPFLGSQWQAEGPNPGCSPAFRAEPR